jgi:hypothetical protein
MTEKNTNPPLFVKDLPLSVRAILMAEAERQDRSLSSLVRTILAREAAKIERRASLTPDNVPQE